MLEAGTQSGSGVDVAASVATGAVEEEAAADEAPDERANSTTLMINAMTSAAPTPARMGPRALDLRGGGPCWYGYPCHWPCTCHWPCP